MHIHAIRCNVIVKPQPETLWAHDPADDIDLHDSKWWKQPPPPGWRRAIPNELEFIVRLFRAVGA